MHADILEICYSRISVDEVRLHHVFEHFSRPTACALLAGWHSWLKPNGKLHIEVPDFQRTAWSMLNPVGTFKRRAVAERHIFGSHEAFWAVHCEGYTPKMLKRFVEAFGFKVTAVKKNHWRGTHNFELLAQKSYNIETKEEFQSIAESYLSKFLVDTSEVELRLLSVWLDRFDAQIDRSWGK